VWYIQVIFLLVCIGCIYKSLINTSEAKPMYSEKVTEEEYDLLQTRFTTALDPLNRGWEAQWIKNAR